MAALSIRQVKEILMSQPGVVEGFVQVTLGNEEYKSSKNSGGGWNMANRDIEDFRVWLRTEKTHGDNTKRTMKEAAIATLTECGLEIPKEIQNA